jgi:hypothetical protein
VTAAVPWQAVGQLLETIWRVGQLTAEMELPEYGADERRNASEYQSKQHDLVYDTVRWVLAEWRQNKDASNTIISYYEMTGLLNGKTKKKHVKGCGLE